jgi:flagellar biosynthesis/type III secretory pathway protein FliH
MIEVLKQALEALEYLATQIKPDYEHSKAITSLRQAIEQAEKQEPVAKAWDEGYRAGVNDERMSEANIGIAGFNAKVEPARNNPYLTTPQPQREWVGMIHDEVPEKYKSDSIFIEGWLWAESKLKEKNQ